MGIVSLLRKPIHTLYHADYVNSIDPYFFPSDVEAMLMQWRLTAAGGKKQATRYSTTGAKLTYAVSYGAWELGLGSPVQCWRPDSRFGVHGTPFLLPFVAVLGEVWR